MYPSYLDVRYWIDTKVQCHYLKSRTNLDLSKDTEVGRVVGFNAAVFPTLHR